MIVARQSTARTVTVGPVLDADGVAVTGGVVGDFKISKNGGAPAALNGSATLTHRHTGHYSLALTASDLDTVGQAEVVIDDTVNACPMKEITVLEEAVYDSLFAAAAAGYGTDVAAIKAKTDNLPPIPAAVGSAMTLVNVDGLTFADYMESIVAVLFGVAVPSGSTVAFRKRDGSTTKVTITYGVADGERTGSVIS